jgi:spore coat polysaccharide biosynthesis protein SpsF
MNDQEALWAGDFGKVYTIRQNHNLMATRVFFRKALAMAILSNPQILELGAGVGHNLLALRKKYEGAWLTGVEINPRAFDELQIVANKSIHCSLLDFAPKPDERWDLVFTKGVLIHVHPTDLEQAYTTIYECSSQYILLCEYFNPTPVALEYRGNEEALWKRDFAGDMLDMFTLKVLDYGFFWSRDKYPQDDLHWVLMEKPQKWAAS